MTLHPTVLHPTVHDSQLLKSINVIIPNQREYEKVLTHFRKCGWKNQQLSFGCRRKITLTQIHLMNSRRKKAEAATAEYGNNGFGCFDIFLQIKIWLVLSQQTTFLSTLPSSSFSNVRPVFLLATTSQLTFFLGLQNIFL